MYTCATHQAGPVVRKVDNAAYPPIHWITQLVSLILIHWIAIYSLDKVIKRFNNRDQVNNNNKKPLCAYGCGCVLLLGCKSLNMHNKCVVLHVGITHV